MRAVASATLVVVLLAIFALAAWPTVTPGQVRGPRPDSFDYAYGAVALLDGRYVVDWDGAPRVPRYTPGFSLLLTPAVAAGGVESAIWVPYGTGLALGALAALMAARLGGPLAAPVAVVTVLCAVAPFAFSRMVMSDLPTVLLTVLEVALLAFGRGTASAVGAGVLAGALVWIRPAAAVLLAAGLAGLTARPGWRRGAWYLAGALPLILLLGAWQHATFSSALTTSYQAAGASPGRSQELGSFFSWQYALGPPHQRDAHPLGLELPNALLYPLGLVGADFFLALPGVGLIGLLALLRFARQRGELGVVGRFGLASVLATLAVYVPYFYQSPRFPMVPAALINLAAAVIVARWLARIGPAWLPGARDRASGDA